MTLLAVYVNPDFCMDKIPGRYVTCCKPRLPQSAKTRNKELFAKSRTTLCNNFEQPATAGFFCYTGLIRGWYIAQCRYSTRFAEVLQNNASCTFLAQPEVKVKRTAKTCNLFRKIVAKQGEKRFCPIRGANDVFSTRVKNTTQPQFIQ